MALTFKTREESFSVYTRPDGTLVYLPHGGERMDWDRDAAQDMWDAFPGTWDAFLVVLDAVMDDVDVVKCDDCHEVTHVDDATTPRNIGAVCQSCLEQNDYVWVDCCSEYVNGDYYNVIDDECICDSCTANNYTYCDDCDRYVSDDYECDHSGENICGCEAPHQRFSIRNNGNDPLSNDERVTVTLPAGVVDEVGQQRVINLLWSQDVNNASALAAEIGPEATRKDGNYAKRFSRAVWKSKGVKLSPEIMSEIGNIASAHSTAVDHAIEITRDLNQSAADFGNEDSCWFTGGEYGHSRCTLKQNGGFGLRTFADNGRGFQTVSGRAWVMPMLDGTPTHDAQTADSFLVFNCYGDLEGYTAARIVAYMAGKTYKKVTLHANRMYINSDMGYLISAEPIEQTSVLITAKDH